MNLLDKIADKSGVLCLSDLKNTGAWKSVICSIDSSTDPLDDWNEAALYLCGINKKFDAAEKAKEYLMKFQKKNSFRFSAHCRKK